MESSTFLYMVFFCTVALVLMAFAVFMIGFLIGYKTEDKRIKTKKYMLENKNLNENMNDEKAKKDWKRFLEYDGSMPYETMWNITFAIGI